jgi:hypothetical protein
MPLVETEARFVLFVPTYAYCDLHRSPGWRVAGEDFAVDANAADRCLGDNHSQYSAWSTRPRQPCRRKRNLCALRNRARQLLRHSDFSVRLLLTCEAAQLRLFQASVVQ